MWCVFNKYLLNSLINSLFYFPQNHLCTKQSTGPWSWGWTKQDVCPHPVHSFLFVVVQSLSHAWPFVTPWTAAFQASLAFTISQSLLKLMSLESYNYLILCLPFHLLPSIFPSIRVFSNDSTLRIRGPKHWSFSFSINEYSGLTSIRINWFDLLGTPWNLQGTLKSPLQHHSSKA